jgi:multicomponent Na+:H+ antiporter subunit B
LNKWFPVVVLCLFVGLLFYAEKDLPAFGDINAPQHVRVSPEYIQRAYEETHTPEFVTAVLADYRGYDTLGETTVIFTAGIICILLLMGNGKNDRTL